MLSLALALALALALLLPLALALLLPLALSSSLLLTLNCNTDLFLYSFHLLPLLVQFSSPLFPLTLRGFRSLTGGFSVSLAGNLGIETYNSFT